MELLNRRITLVIPSLQAGGAERVMAILANYWAERGEQITLVTLRDDVEDHYPLDAKVERARVKFYWSSQGLVQRSLDQLRRLRRLRQTILSTKPDVVISFLDKNNVRVLLSLIGNKVPVVVCERNHPKYQIISPSWQRLRKIMYPRAAWVVSQTDAVTSWLTTHTRNKRISTIANPVLPQMDNTELDLQSHRVVSIGRLTHQKGFDLLLHSWADLALNARWQLDIVGEGEDRPQLEALAKTLGIDHQVVFHGVMKRPTEILSQASIFVLSSRYEGFPNVLLEAMACGLPVVSFDCPSGPGDIVRHGVNGLLVPPGDTQTFTRSLNQLMDSEQQRRSMSAQAPEVLQRFSLPRIVSHWDALVKRVT